MINFGLMKGLFCWHDSCTIICVKGHANEGMKSYDYKASLRPQKWPNFSIYPKSILDKHQYFNGFSRTVETLVMKQKKNKRSLTHGVKVCVGGFSDTHNKYMIYCLYIIYYTP